MKRSLAVLGITLALGAGAALSSGVASAKPKPKPTRVSLGEYEEYYNDAGPSSVQVQFVDDQYNQVKDDIDTCNSDQNDANAQSADQQNAENRKTLYFAREKGDMELVKWAQGLDGRAEAYRADLQADVRTASSKLSSGFAKLVDALSYYFSAEQGLASLNCNQTPNLNDGLRNFLESRPRIRAGFDALNKAVEKQP